MLISDPHVHFFKAATGELLPELTIAPARDYQPTAAPPRPQTRKIPSQ
jgi:hypothetical protein